MRTKRYLWVALALVALLVAAGLYVRSGRPETGVSDTVVMAAVLPLSGTTAAIGTPKKEAIELALDAIRQEYPGLDLQVRFEDSRGTPRDGIAALTNGVTVGNARLAFVDLTTVVAAAIPVVDEHNLLTFAGSAQAGITDKSSNVFRIFPGGDQEIDLIVAFLKQDGAKRLFVLHTNELYGQSVAELLGRRATDLGATVVGSAEYALADTDYTTQLSRAKASNAEKILLLGYGVEYERMLRQANELGIKPQQFVSNLGAVNVTVTQMPSQFTEGMTFAGPAFAFRMENLAAHPKQQQMVEAYKAKYGKTPDFRVAFVYDTMMILANALEKGGDLRRARDELLRVNGYEGVSGTISILPNRDARVDIVLARYQGGKIVRLPGEASDVR